ncbi:MAG: DUF1360 domain-containing protein [Thermoleophilaceae bacterium]
MSISQRIGYSAEPKPLGSYAVLAGGFNAALAGFIAARRRSGRDLPERIGPGDVALMGAATHKLARLIAKDKVTSFARAPFVRYEGDAGPSEVDESPRGSGLRLAVGELVSCPFCLGQWVAAGFAAGLVSAPRTTRFVASIFAAHAIADGLNVVYKLGEEEM